jgi:hypothetical protein
MATGDTTQGSLCLELGAETICGTLADERGNERRFWGWLELSGALEELRGIDAGAGAPMFTKLPPSTTNQPHPLESPPCLARGGPGSREPNPYGDP